MNDYLIFPVIFVMLLLFFFNFMIIDGKFHKAEMNNDRECHKAEMRDVEFKYKLESIDRRLDRLTDEVRKK